MNCPLCDNAGSGNTPSANRSDELQIVCPVCGVHSAVPPKVAERASDFVGRHATLKRIDEWLTDPGSDPVLILKGGPGSGKSALMAWLCGAGPAPLEPEFMAIRERIRSAIDAAHFCVATNSGTHFSLDPARFATRLSEQLSIRLPGYGAQLLLESDQKTVINVKQTSQSGSMIGVVVKQLQSRNAASVFSAILEPLLSINLERDQIVFLIDALDEAELWPDVPSIGELIAGAVETSQSYGAPNIRFLVTTRPRDNVLNRYPGQPQWDLTEDAVDDECDLREYVLSRLNAAGRTDSNLSDKFVESSEGNFLYAKTALDFWIPRLDEIQPGVELDLPPQLDGIYTSFLQREFGSNKKGREHWKQESKYLLGTLGVAQESLDAEQLQFVLDFDEMDRIQDTLTLCAPYLDGDRPNGPFDLYHQSFREFLFDSEHNSDFLLSQADANARTAHRYLDSFGHDWGSCVDNYGLQHTPIHLAEAARHSSRYKRPQFISRLIELVADSSYREERLARVGDTAALQKDLLRTVEEACLNEARDAFDWIAAAVKEFDAFRAGQTDPSRVFQLAESGNLAAAEEHLDLFNAETCWQRVSLLIAAWLGADSSPDSARQLLAKLEQSPIYIDPLSQLAQRIGDALATAPQTVYTGASLPSPDFNLIESILMRARGGSAVQGEELLDSSIHEQNVELLAHLEGQREAMASELISQIGGTLAPRPGAQTSDYLGGIDGPYLVGFAIEYPEEGKSALEEYIDLLAANGYVFYRNRSLWALLYFIVQHPEQAFVKAFSRRICEAALAGSHIGFEEYMEIAQTALQQERGQAPARFDERLAAGLAEAEKFNEPLRGKGDIWGQNKRRLGALAESLFLVFGDAPKAGNLVAEALELQFGFAGYEAPACLALAESSYIVNRDASDLIHAALQRSKQAAHCVQDPLFCARTSSRCNAMEIYWRKQLDAAMSASDLSKTIERFVQNPLAAEFSAIHIVGEDYPERQPPPFHLEIPDWARQARSLEELGRVYEVNLTAMLNANREPSWASDHQLPMGSEVRIPDPEMVQLMATWLSVLALVTPGLNNNERVRLVQSMIPVVVENPVAVDTVLARLLLLVRPENLEIFAPKPPTHMDRAVYNTVLPQVDEKDKPNVHNGGRSFMRPDIN